MTDVIWFYVGLYGFAAFLCLLGYIFALLEYHMRRPDSANARQRSRIGESRYTSLQSVSSSTEQTQSAVNQEERNAASQEPDLEPEEGNDEIIRADKFMPSQKLPTELVKVHVSRVHGHESDSSSKQEDQSLQQRRPQFPAGSQEEDDVPQCFISEKSSSAHSDGSCSPITDMDQSRLCSLVDTIENFAQQRPGR